MKNWIGLAVLALALLGVPQLASAQVEPRPATPEATAAPGGGSFVIPGGGAGLALGAAIGTGLIVMGAAAGIGRIGSSAVEAIARQPEAGGRIFTSMLLSAALIEGFTLFGVVVTFLIQTKIASGLG